MEYHYILCSIPCQRKQNHIWIELLLYVQLQTKHKNVTEQKNPESKKTQKKMLKWSIERHLEIKTNILTFRSQGFKTS